MAKNVPLLRLIFIGLTVIVCSPGAEKQVDPPSVSPEAQFLDRINRESDPEQRLILLDQFILKYPTYAGMNAVYAELQAACLKLKLYDRALELGTELLEADPEHIGAVKANILAANALNDKEAVKKWTDLLTRLEQPEPEGDVTTRARINLPYVPADEAPAAEQAPAAPIADVKHTESSLFNRAVAQKNPLVRLALLEQFSREFPASAHRSYLDYLYFATHRELGDDAKALEAAERTLSGDMTREDVLSFVLDNYSRNRKEPEKQLTYALILRTLVASKPKPEHLTEEDWNKQRNALLLQSHWVSGTVYVQKEQWANAEKDLRSTLMLYGKSDQTAASILQALAFVCYRQRNVPEALKLYEQCAKIGGPLQAVAKKSIVAVKNEYGLPQ